MRVTQNMLNNNMIMNLNRSMKNMEKYQDQLATGRKINKPSDDPVIAVRGMYYRTSLLEIDQFKRNVSEAQNWMDLTDKSIMEAGDVLKRAKELLIQGANDTLGQPSRDAISKELSQLRDQLGTIANASIGGRYIFAGTETDQPPYAEGADGKRTFINENNAKIELELDKGINIPVNVNGTEIFSVPDRQNGVFGLFDRMIEDMDNGGKQASSQLGDLEEQIDVVLSVQASLGARSSRIDLISARLDSSETNLKTLMSKNEDADIAQVITELRNQENVHRAALGAGARIIQPSLLDFLR